MPEVYYYVKSEKVSDLISCGIKLSAFYNKEVIIDGEKKLCLSGLLNPRDNIELYRSEEFCCLKLLVKADKCYVADRFIYTLAKEDEQTIELYYKTVMSIENYKFGIYREPECLITTTILPGEVTLLNKRMDSPVLYINSEELYLSNVLQNIKDEFSEIDDCLLYYFLDKLAENGIVEKIESKKGDTIFKDMLGKIYCAKKPDLNTVVSYIFKP